MPQRVFISYSHDSETHERNVLDIANRLRKDGIEAWIDQYELHPTRGWPLWMVDQLENADWVIIVVSEEYKKRMMNPAPLIGKGIAWEGLIITQNLYDAHSQNTQFIPVLFSSSDTPHIPTPLKPYTYICMEDSNGYEELYRRITEQPKIIAPKIGHELVLPPHLSVDSERSTSDKLVLSRYSSEWLKHPTDITSVEDYYTWHESPEFWKSGCGEMFAISNREMGALWTMSRYSTVYEVWLKRFLNLGGIASRIYVLGEEYVNSTTHELFLSVAYRHYVLGFKPKLAYLPHTEKYRMNLLKANCDTYAVLNREVCLLYQFPPFQYPMFARTTHHEVIHGAINAHDSLIHETIDFEKWYRENKSRQLSATQMESIESEAARICEIASLGSIL
jgi:hypothetical protein